MPTAPEAPIAPQISIGDRIHGIESRIEEIEGISGINSSSKSRNNSNSQRQQGNDSEEAQEEQSQTSQQSQPRQTQSTPQVQQRQPSAKKVETPETMARDAVANGSGALTKRTTQRGSDNDSQNADGGDSQAKNQTTVVIPPNSALNDNGQTSYERGRAVLNEFKQLDQEEAAKQGNFGNTSSSSSTPSLFASSYDSNSHGAAYWLFTLIAVGVLAFVFVKQFLVNKDAPSDTPPLTKSTLDIPDISKPPVMRKAALNQYKQNVPTPPTSQKPKPAPPITKPAVPITKPVTLKTKSTVKTEDDNKGGHFEIRV